MHFSTDRTIELERFALTSLLIIVLLLDGGASLGLENGQIVSSKNILEEINKSKPIDYRSVIIDGNLNLSNFDSSGKKSIRSTITIVNCVIKGNVYFNKTIFRMPVNFEKTRFSGSANFDETQFLSFANFSQCIFMGEASFSGVKFARSVSFWKSFFKKFSTFKKTEFHGSIVDFHRTDFEDNASFNFAEFDVDEAFFENTNFNRTVNFQKAKFNGRAVFLGARFRDMAEFSESQFNASSQFVGARFDKELYFYNVKFKNFNIFWDSVHNKLISDEPGYISLINNFKGLGQFEDADSCYYQYREWKQNNRPDYDFKGKIWDFLAWISCGYGVRWTHPMISGVIAIFLFGIYYWICNSLTMIGAQLSGNSPSKDISRELLEEFESAILLSVICLLSLPGEWYPYEKEEFSRFIRSHFFVAILERLIGWGLVLLLIGTLTRLMVRY